LRGLPSCGPWPRCFNSMFVYVRHPNI
jgi:hypothetical protein